MKVRGIIFDMGGTLLRYHPPGGDWEAMEKAGARAMLDMLGRLGYSVPDDGAEQTWFHLRQTWISLGQGAKLSTLKLGYQLRELTISWGLSLSDSELSVVEHAFTSGAQVYVRPFEGALHTLQSLKARGFPIGLISNTIWRGSAHRYDLTHFGMWPYLDFALFSSDELAWKPYTEVFDQALGRMGLAPDEVVYVGDSLFFDVYGSQQAGLKAVWIEQPTKWWPPELGVDDIIPDATVTTIAEVLSLLE